MRQAFAIWIALNSLLHCQIPVNTSDQGPEYGHHVLHVPQPKLHPEFQPILHEARNLLKNGKHNV